MPVNETEIQDRIKKQVDNEIATQRQSINNSLNIQKREFDNTINRNNKYLDEQIKGLNTSKLVNDDKIMTIQNRFGGIYSGGKDYQLAENQRSTSSAQDNIRRDINDKNQEVLGQYNTLASQAAENIRMLETQSIDKIRQMVNEEIQKQRSLQMEEEKWALEKQQMELALAKARASASGGSGSRRSSSGSSSSSSGGSSSNLTNQYNQYKSQSVMKPTALANLDIYYRNQEGMFPKPVKQITIPY